MTDYAPIDKVVVDGLHRLDLGDLRPLVESIRDLGLLHPIVVTPDYRLVAGQRRLAACRQLGFDEIPVRVVHNMTTAAALLRAERDENTCRLDFKPSEAVALGLRLESLEKPKADERKREAGKTYGRGQSIGGGDSPPPIRKGKVRDIVAPEVGMTPTRYAHAKTVVTAAQDETLPDEVREVAADALREMDETGKVETAYRKVLSVKEPRTPAPAPKASPQDRSPIKRSKGGRSSAEQVVSNAMHTLGAVASVLDSVDVDALDISEADVWKRSLADAQRSIRNFRSRLDTRSVPDAQ